MSLIPIEVTRAQSVLAGWDYRVKLTLDQNDIDVILSDFPVLIYISADSGRDNEDVTFIFDEVGVNSLKIAITESDGITECYVEIEKWDLGNEEAWIWAKIPSIASGEDTDIYLYYDNAHADNIGYVGVTNSVVAENVWSDFLLVDHMADGADTSHTRDSTSNDNDGIKNAAGGPALTTSGIIGNAQHGDGVDDYLTYATLLDAVPANGAISVWVKPDDDSESSDKRIFTKINEEGGSRDAMDVFWNADGNKHVYASKTIEGSGSAPESTTNLASGSFFLITAVWGSGNNKIYIGDTEEADGGVTTDWNDGTTRDAILFAYNDGGGISQPWDGIIDEIRVSSVYRNASWIKAEHETGRDDLIDWGAEESLPGPNLLLFGAGFNASSPYVDLHWNHSLVDVQFFEVQNSSDAESWTYLGQSTTDNYTDTQVNNGTARYYRVRACNQTGGTWYNSSFSDVNFEKVYFTEIVNWFCDSHFFNASSINVVVGTLNDGNLASTYFVDNDWYNVSEDNAEPGLDVRFNFTDIDQDLECGCIDVFHTYTGHAHHDIGIEVWNFTSTSWDQIGVILYNETSGWVCMGVGHNPEHFVNEGNMTARFYHESRGHLNHELHIDRIALRAVYAEEGEISLIIESDFPWIAIAIILSCIVYLLLSTRK